MNIRLKNLLRVVFAFSPFSLHPSLLLADTDLELSDLNLPKLVLPAEPPAHLRLPDVIVRKDEWKGVQCAVTAPRVAVFRHADAWKSFWEKAMAPYSPKLAVIPAIDFQKEMVVGVFLGEFSSPNVEVEIRSISTLPSQERLVRYREIHRMKGVFTPPFAIQPFHLKKVPVAEGEIRFEKSN